MFEVDRAPQELSFGRQGESNILSYAFDFSAWAEEWPGGLASMTVTLPNQTQPQPIPDTQAVVDGTLITLYVLDNLTEKNGRGTLIIRYVAGPNKKRSRLIEFVVEKGHETQVGSGLAVVEDWVDEAVKTLDDVKSLTFTINNNGELLAGETILGRVSYNPRGDYNPAADPLYSLLDLVSDGGGSFVYINDTPSNEPTSSTSHWQQIAEKGDTGPSAYDAAVAGGYTGTEAEFNAANAGIEAAKDAALDAAQTANEASEIALAISTANTWERVAYFVRLGKGPQVFPVGTVLRTPHTTYGEILWRVMAHNHDVNKNAPELPTMRLEMISCIYGRQADAPELLWANTGASELPVGTYNFTLLKADNAGDIREDGTYQFTTAQAIPVGGGFQHSQAGLYRSSSELYVPANLVGNYLTTYNASGVAIESNLSVTAGSGGTALGTASRNWADTVNIIGRFNSTQRNAYGSNHAGESGVRQWLNSDLGANLWWVKKTTFDLKPSYANQPGFLAGFDADFLDALVTVDNVCARNTIFEEGGTLGGSYITTDKMFRPSMTELGLGVNNAIAEGAVLDYYDGTTALERIKFDIASPATARYWWLRSPYPSYANRVRSIVLDGALYDSAASNGYGVAPDCVIG